MTTKAVQVSFRVEEDVLEQLDELGELLAANSPAGLGLKRAAVMRMCMLRGLEVLRSELTKSKGRPKR